jgi:hypothetical protein
MNGSIQTSTGTPANPGLDILNTSSLSIINLTRVTKDITVVVSDTDFTGPVHASKTAGSGVWQGAIGSSITLSRFDDPDNEQGTDTIIDTPGNLIDSVSNTAPDVADAFAHDGSGAVTTADCFR